VSPTARHRPDTTKAALVAHAKSLGLGYLDINGVIDGVLYLGRRVELVDWKSPGGTLTDAQAKLVAKGAPITFITTVEQLEALARDMKGRRDALMGVK